MLQVRMAAREKYRPMTLSQLQKTARSTWVSPNGQLLGRRGRSSPANASGFETRRDSITSRFGSSASQVDESGSKEELIERLVNVDLGTPTVRQEVFHDKNQGGG
eukprot:COSAG01_NODE_11466_length_1928_cov_3.286495_3_plen_105_part_00